MIENIKRWRFELDDGLVVITMYGETGLVNFAIDKDGKKIKELVGWNIYSVLRSFFEFNKKVVAYRWKEKEKVFQKLNTEKIKEIAYSPIEQ